MGLLGNFLVAGRRAEQVGGLPDLQAMVTGYIEPPETRVGPQRQKFALTQTLPLSSIIKLDGFTSR